MAKKPTKAGAGTAGGAAVADDQPAVEGTVEFQVGDVVHFYERARWVSAVEGNKKPEPLAGIITRITEMGNVSLTILDPDIGHLPRRQVPFSVEPRADHWTARPGSRSPVATVNATDLAQAMKPLIDAAVAEQLEAALPKAEEGEGEPAGV